MAPHSSTLAWRIPWMEEPGRLQSMGSLRVGQKVPRKNSQKEFIGKPEECSRGEKVSDFEEWRKGGEHSGNEN